MSRKRRVDMSGPAGRFAPFDTRPPAELSRFDYEGHSRMLADYERRRRWAASPEEEAAMWAAAINPRMRQV